MKKTINYIAKILKLIFTLPIILYFIFSTIFFLIKNRKKSNIVILLYQKKSNVERFLYENNDAVNHCLYIFWILIFTYFTFF
jgi:hypothetical protein